MEFLLLVNTFGMVLVLFGAAAAAAGWAAWRILQALRARPEPEGPGRSDRRAVDQWDPNHPLFGKRAGQ